LVRGHDGGEYLDFARALMNFDLVAVPLDARRHDGGWPLLLAAFSWAGPLWAVSIALIWACLAGCIVAFAWLLRRAYALPSREIVLLLFALGLAYPTFVYYQLFALGEAPFLLFVLLAFCAHARGKPAAAYCLAGIAALIRSPGLLVGLGFLIADTLPAPRWKHLAAAPIVAVPQAAWFLVTRAAWDGSAAEIHAPVFGFPFSALLAFGADTPALKAVYILSAVAVICAGVAALVRETAASGWTDRTRNAAVAFCLCFLLFHLSLKSLRYLGSDVPTFPYFDRYLVGILPFALLGLRVWMRPWMVACAAVASVALSVYWASNYAAAAHLWGGFIHGPL
jgi:hypothetical protein